MIICTERNGAPMSLTPIQAYSIIFFTGGFLYCGIEVLYRGYSHISMFFTAGICFVLIGVLEHIFHSRSSLLLQMLVCGLMITGIEYVVGLFVNHQLHLHVWDYTGRPFNLHGQICLLNSTLWCLLSGPAILLFDLMRYLLLGIPLPHYRIF